MKGCRKEEEESKATEPKSKNIGTNNNTTTEPSDTSKENSKISEVQKPDYIHVRARRGQATDSHSLAERVSYSVNLIRPPLFPLLLIHVIWDQFDTS